MDQLSLEIDEYVVFDLETTGLSPWGGDEMIEIGAMKIYGDSIDETNVFQTFVNPQRMISAEATQINGITNEMVKDAPLAEKVVVDFLDFVGTARLVAQNAKFDMSFLTKYLMQFKIKKDLEVFDTMSFSRRAFPEEKRHNLDLISKRLNIAVNQSQRHRSIEDVRITAHAFVKLREKLAGRCPQPEKYSI